MSEQDIFGSAYKPTKRKSTKAAKKIEVSPDKSVSYRIGSDLQQRVKKKAQVERVAQADLVKFLLMQGLDALDTGALELPTIQPEPKRLKIKTTE